MMELNWEGSENSGRRYMEFSKNRVGQVGKKLYFDLEGGVSFDEARYARDLFNDQIVQEERKALDSEADAFDAPPPAKLFLPSCNPFSAIVLIVVQADPFQDCVCD